MIAVRQLTETEFGLQACSRVFSWIQWFNQASKDGAVFRSFISD
jgi:hypothetical protein